MENEPSAYATELLENAVAQLSVRHEPLRNPTMLLRPFEGDPKVNDVVWIYGTGGKWRPAMVEKLGRVNVHVVHSSPSNPTRMYRKAVRPENLKTR